MVAPMTPDTEDPRIEARFALDGLPSRDDGDRGRDPFVLLDGLEYIENRDCPECEREIAGVAWVRDFVLRTRWHANCWRKSVGALQ